MVFTIVLPLILYPVMGFIIMGAMSTATEKVKHGTVGIIDEDNSELSGTLINFIRMSGMNVIKVNRDVLDNPPESLLAVIIIPKGYGENILNETPPSITIYTFLQGINVGEQGVMGAVTSVIESYKNFLKSYIAKQHGVNPEIISNPITEDVHIYVRSWEREFTSQELNTITMQVMFWPWLIFSLVVSVVQLSATFLSEEKEQKTLEILLTLPVRRTIILFSKVLGSGVLAILATISYTVGFIVYIMAFSSYLEQYGMSISISMDPFSIILMGVIFFLCLLFSSALGLSISVLAQDTKSAESLASTVIFPIMVIAFVIMFLDISSLPLYLQLLIYIIPYTYLMEGIKYMFIGRYEVFLAGIVVNLVGALVMLSIVSKIFTSERILTMKVRFGRKRKAG